MEVGLQNLLSRVQGLFLGAVLPVTIKYMILEEKKNLHVRLTMTDFSQYGIWTKKNCEGRNFVSY